MEIPQGGRSRPLGLPPESHQLHHFHSVGSPRGLPTVYFLRKQQSNYTRRWAREQMYICPLQGQCGSLHSVKGRDKRTSSALDCILAFGQSATSIFPFIAFTKCALILNKKLSVRPTGFLQNSNLSKHREMCSHSLRSLGYISRLLGSILRPLFQLDIYGEREPPMDSHKWQPLTPLHYVSLFSPKGASPLMDTPKANKKKTAPQSFSFYRYSNVNTSPVVGSIGFRPACLNDLINRSIVYDFCMRALCQSVRYCLE